MKVESILSVIPAKAGIHFPAVLLAPGKASMPVMDSGFRRSDGGADAA